MQRRSLLVTVAIVLGSTVFLQPAAAAPVVYGDNLPRSTTDRADQVSGQQVHIIYVLPSDGQDRAFDTNGALKNSVSSFQTWLSDQTGGRSLRFDTFQGSLDISFFRLSRTEAQIESFNQYVRDEIEKETKAAGFNAANKIYAVYYDGTSNWSCGGGAWPPTLVGNVAALYLNGLPNEPNKCANNQFAAPGGPPTYWEFGMLHEIMHTLGFVATCAPNHTLAGHTSENANDLMWAGTGNWFPDGYGSAVLDFGNNDYYNHSNAGCLDFSDSAFLTSNASAPTISSFTPTSGVAGTSVTIAGTNFTGATAVTFNGQAATFSVISATQISATVPVTASTGKIAVVTPGGTATSSTNFTIGGGTCPSSAQVSVSSTTFTPKTAKAQQGGCVVWNFNGPGNHSASETKLLGPGSTPLFNSGSKAPGTTFSYTFVAAGGYNYRSTVAGDPSTMVGVVKVPVKLSATSGGVSTSISVTWASASTAGYRSDVQLRYKPPGGSYGAWMNWRVDQTGMSATFLASAASGKGVYQFRARYENASTAKASGWSATVTLTIN